MKRRSLLLVGMVLGLMLAMPLHMQRPCVSGTRARRAADAYPVTA